MKNQSIYRCKVAINENLTDDRFRELDSQNLSHFYRDNDISALSKFYDDYSEDKKSVEKKNFHFLSEDSIQSFDEAKNNPALQAQVVRESNRFEDRENDMFNHKDYDDRDDR